MKDIPCLDLRGTLDDFFDVSVDAVLLPSVLVHKWLMVDALRFDDRLFLSRMVDTYQ